VKSLKKTICESLDNELFSIFMFNYHVRVQVALTVSMADISVLHSVEVVQLYPQAVYPI
jgi:hypothetical protein